MIRNLDSMMRFLMICLLVCCGTNINAFAASAGVTAEETGGVDAAGSSGSGGVDAERLVRRAYGMLYANPKEASSLANRALRLCDLAKPDSICREATIIYGDAEQLLGNFDLSIRILFDAEQMTDPNDRHTLARIRMLQGRVFSKLGDYARSNELNDRATATFKSLGDSTFVAQCYTQRGVTLLNQEEPQLAELFFRKSLAINREKRNLEAIAHNLNNMCLYPGDSAEKLRMIEEAISINKQLDSKWALGENYNNKGKQLCYAGRYKEALEALRTASDYIDEIGAKELLCDNYEYFAMAYAGLGNYKAAYEDMEKMAKLSADLQRHNSQRSADLDITRKRFADQVRAAEKQEQDYKIKILHRNLWILFAGVVVIVICGFFYYKASQHKKNMEILRTSHELSEKEKEVDRLTLRQKELELENAQITLTSNQQELTSFAAFLKSRNELMEKIKSMLKEGYKLPVEGMVAHMKKISAFITTYASHDNTSRALLMKVEEHNKGFLDALEARHPNLTKGERNLAILIRGGLSSKEISMLLGLEPKTINMNRYRLRKALDLDAEADLEEYLRGI